MFLMFPHHQATTDHSSFSPTPEELHNAQGAVCEETPRGQKKGIPKQPTCCARHVFLPGLEAVQNGDQPGPNAEWNERERETER